MTREARFLSCPSGTLFYACDSNKFRGCCAEDPCALAGCARGVNAGDDAATAVAAKKEGPESQPSTASDSVVPTSTTRTDSGITHTIPNNSVVTVTRHTVIFSEAPPSPAPSTTDTITARSTASAGLSGPTGVQTGTAPQPGVGDAAHHGLSSGAIAGAATGGALVLALVAIAWLVLKRRRRSGSSRGSVYASEPGTLETRAETQEKSDAAAARVGSDPFAPFGGRADQPEDPFRPHGGAFEMDGTSTAPVELPVVNVVHEAPDDNNVVGVVDEKEKQKRSPESVVSHPLPVSPLTPLPATLNQWDRYRDLARDVAAQEKD